MSVVERDGIDHSKFVRDIVWIGISQVLTSLLGLALMPVLTKTYSTEIYGIWVQVSVTLALIVPVWMLLPPTAFTVNVPMPLNSALALV